MTLFFFAIFFVFGLIIGSFLNVVICRINTARSFGGRSACMSCQYNLAWYDLVPLFSFLALRGRCRTCRTRISYIYPLVEVITGLVFLVLFCKLQNLFFLSALSFILSYFYYATLFSLLVVIAIYDFRHKIIPDSLSFIFGILAFLGLFFFETKAGQIGGYEFFFHLPTLLDFFSGILVASPFVLLWIISKGAWIGLGDAKLVVGLGWFLGLGQALSGIVLSFWTGAVIGLSLIIFSKGYGMKSEIPFAIYLVFGAFMVFIFELNFFAVGF